MMKLKLGERDLGKIVRQVREPSAGAGAGAGAGGRRQKCVRASVYSEILNSRYPLQSQGNEEDKFFLNMTPRCLLHVCRCFKKCIASIFKV
jgi:hypothetical protein